MSDSLLMGHGRLLIPIPRIMWQEHVSKSARHTETSLGFMSEEHHLIRNFIVRELPRVGRPLSPEFISQQLNLPVTRVNIVLDELEKHMTFLFRDEQVAVAWAYPVTTERTPHHIAFSTGEQIYAA